MKNPNIIIKKKLIVILFAIMIALAGLCIRIFYIQYFQAEFLQSLAFEQQTRDRLIKPNRGAIFDRNMVGMALTETVASVSVINSQIREPERVARILSEMLELDYDYVLEKVQRRLALERIQTRVDRDIANQIAALNLAGVVIDEDIRRIYPYSTLASQVIGFVGRDNQGIIGLEAKFEGFLRGESGRILTETDVIGREVAGGQRERVAPIDGYSIVTTIDVVVQLYAEQILEKAVEFKSAQRGTIIIMNPQNGEIYAMANKPDFNLNDPFSINDEELRGSWATFTAEEQNRLLNQMWRNFSINDTYEPGSTFKIITSAAGFEEGIITPETMFVCTGAHMVGDRLIRCWRYPRSHGALNFAEAVQNSCNPVFMMVAEKLGTEMFFNYLDRFGIDDRTGIDLPGEAVAIMHSLDNVGPVELATMSFGQSFQITPLQLMRSVSAVVNGGYMITPHFVKKAIDSDGNIVERFENPRGEQIISAETSRIMAEILEDVVYVGTGHRTYIPGYRIGGKTATSEKLPRRSGKYISSFLTFAPAENPTVMALMLVDEPQGVYYGGAVVGPFMRELLMNILPYLGVEPMYNDEELELPWVRDAVIPDVLGVTVNEANRLVREAGLVPQVFGDGENVREQFPRPGEAVNSGSRVKIYTTF
ncbi:MAG: penicillin-binding transpeptidase domain-containing protein [Defluviitaleaceae bacterium]|nr:penicillin-binding transpeptidase domain-containing protein [Defluviitaleaceae bacterium]